MIDYDTLERHYIDCLRDLFNLPNVSHALINEYQSELDQVRTDRARSKSGNDARLPSPHKLPGYIAPTGPVSLLCYWFFDAKHQRRVSP